MRLEFDLDAASGAKITAEVVQRDDDFVSGKVLFKVSILVGMP